MGMRNMGQRGAHVLSTLSHDRLSGMCGYHGYGDDSFKSFVKKAKYDVVKADEYPVQGHTLVLEFHQGCRPTRLCRGPCENALATRNEQ